MKIIFLDIDGVLNHESFYKQRVNKMNDDIALEYPYSEIDPNSVFLLNELVEQTGAKIVISSTWRHSGLEYCKKVLEYHGFKGDIIDITPSSKCGMCLRGNEIRKWVESNQKTIGPTHKFTEYVILDDDSDMLYWQRNNFLLVDRAVGITSQTIFQAKKILNNGKIVD